jgi:hypothetical protein
MTPEMKASTCNKRNCDSTFIKTKEYHFVTNYWYKKDKLVGSTGYKLVTIP